MQNVKKILKIEQNSFGRNDVINPSCIPKVQPGSSSNFIEQVARIAASSKHINPRLDAQRLSSMVINQTDTEV